MELISALKEDFILMLIGTAFIIYSINTIDGFWAFIVGIIVTFVGSVSLTYELTHALTGFTSVAMVVAISVPIILRKPFFALTIEIDKVITKIKKSNRDFG